MIQLTHNGAVFERDAAWEAVKADFANRHIVVLPQFVEETLLQRMRLLVAESEFHNHETKLRHVTTGRELVLLRAMTSQPRTLFRLFHMLLNSPVLFAAIQELVDCGADRFPKRNDVDNEGVSAFRIGDLHHMAHERGHFDAWHSDLTQGRQIGVSLNLEPDPAAAGGVEIREAPLAPCRVAAGFGDVVLIRIAKGLRHRGLPSTCAVPRCTFAGWFVARPNPYWQTPNWAKRRTALRLPQCLGQSGGR